MDRRTLYLIGIISVIAGSILIGWGIGKLFEKICEGVLIGTGVGLWLIGIISFKIHRRLLAFNKRDL
jgi:hypothetical protein